jgi:hypothetical protein
MFKKTCKSVSTSTVVVSHDPVSPTPSISSAVKTPDPQSHDPSESLIETEETSKNIEWDSVAP